MITRGIKQCNSNLFRHVESGYHIMVLVVPFLRHSWGGNLSLCFTAMSLTWLCACKKRCCYLHSSWNPAASCLQVLGRLRMIHLPRFRIPTLTWTRLCRCTALWAGSGEPVPFRLPPARGAPHLGRLEGQPGSAIATDTRGGTLWSDNKSVWG